MSTLKIMWTAGCRRWSRRLVRGRPWLGGVTPGAGPMYSKLDIITALKEVDRTTAVCRRKHVPPTYSELRNVFNTAQIHEAAKSVKLMTFDADDTLFPAATSLQRDDWVVDAIIVRPWLPGRGCLIRQTLLRRGICVSVVTAAGYPGPAGAVKYETRLRGLLEEIYERGLSEEEMGRFFVLGVRR